MTPRHWQDLTSVDFEGFDLERRVAALPLGANEAPVADHLALLRETDGLLFVYPT